MSWERGFAHQEALLAAAIEEFAARGYAKASLNRILAAAGMSKGQFYHHFAGKEALYFGIIELMIGRKRAFFAGLGAQRPAGGFFEALRAQLHLGLAFAREDPQMERFARSFLGERGRPIYQAVMARYDFARHDPLQQLVAAAMARGELTAALSPAFVGRAVSTLMNAASELIDAGSLEDFEAGLDEFMLLLRRAIGGEEERLA
jgi:TetR/AcrR family transcriptional regulator